MHAPNHPIWPIVRLLVMFVGLTMILWANASRFDATEIRALIAFVVFGGAAEGGVQWLSRRRDCSGDEDEE